MIEIKTRTVIMFSRKYRLGDELIIEFKMRTVLVSNTVLLWRCVINAVVTRVISDLHRLKRKLIVFFSVSSL